MNKPLTFIRALCLLCGVALGCHYSGSNDRESKVERGRLKFAKCAIDINTGKDPIYRDVEQKVFVNGREWSPSGDQKFAGKLNWCDTSPNPRVEILRCFGDASENYDTTYILRMKS